MTKPVEIRQRTLKLRDYMESKLKGCTLVARRSDSRAFDEIRISNKGSSAEVAVQINYTSRHVCVTSRVASTHTPILYDYPKSTGQLMRMVRGLFKDYPAVTV